MKKSKIGDNITVKDKKSQKQSSKLVIIHKNHQPIIQNKITQKYLNSTLNIHSSQKSLNLRDSTDSRKVNIVKSKRSNTPICQLFASSRGLSSSLNKSNKSKQKLGSTIKINPNKKPLSKKKIILEDYLIKQTQDQEQKIWNCIQKQLKDFYQQPQFDDFQQYIQSVGILNHKINNLLGQVEDSKYKQVVSKYKNLVSNISKKCLIKLYDRQQTADVSMNALQKLQIQAKDKYEKKISKLLHTIAQKQRKQKQVNKLLYFLRKNGVDIDDAWSKAMLQQRRSKTQLEKRSNDD